MHKSKSDWGVIKFLEYLKPQSCYSYCREGMVGHIRSITVVAIYLYVGDHIVKVEVRIGL